MAEQDLPRSFVGHFRDAGRQHRSARKFANCRNTGQLNYAWLCASSTLGLDIRVPCVKATHRQPSLGRWDSMHRNASTRPLARAVRRIDSQSIRE